MKTGIVLVAHGSPEPSANRELFQIAEFVREDGQYPIVQAAFLELAEPDIPTGIDLCIEQGAERVIVVPYFLLTGSHVQQDLPKWVGDAARKHPDIPIRVAESLGYHPILNEIVLERVDALLSSVEWEEEES